MKNRLEHQRQFTLAREQLSQKSHLVIQTFPSYNMISYDYDQLSHITLPPQQSLYTSMITYPPNTDTHLLSYAPIQPISYPINTNGGNFEVFS
jgi:hypothetical protein